MKLVFSRQNLEKYSNINFYEYPLSVSRVVLSGQTKLRTEGRTDRHEEANSRFSQFYECAYKLNDIGRAAQNKN